MEPTRIRYVDIRTGQSVGWTALVDGQVISTGVGNGDEDLQVVEPGPRGPIRRITPADGLEWLRALSRQGTGSYLYGVIEPVPDDDLDRLRGRQTLG